MVKIDSKELAARIDEYCKKKGIVKKDFHKGSQISSATLTQWRQGCAVSELSIQRLESYLGMSLEDFLADDETIEIRKMLIDRPELRILFDATKGAPTSSLLEAAALLLKYKEESEGR